MSLALSGTTVLELGQIYQVPYCTLLQEVWNDPSPGERDEAVVVRVTVGRLRQELEDDPRQPTLVRTILGVGVMLNAEP